MNTHELDGFSDGQRVLVHFTVRAGAGADGEPLEPPGKGTVVRLRIADNGAWVALDERRGDARHPFPADDSRATHVLTYPEFCEEVPS